MSSAWIGYRLSSQRLLSCTLLIRNLVHRRTSPVVPNTGSSLRFMMVELNMLMNSFLGTNFMPPKSSKVIVQNMSMFIWGNKTWSIKSRSRILTCSTFPFKSPTTSTRGSQGSSGIESLDMVLQFPVALGIVGSELSQIQW
jgi:hypothetical protein